MTSSGEDMRDAVQALLRDMRGGADGDQAPHASASPARGGSASPRHVGPANLNGSQLADVDAMRAEIYRLETELHNAQQALDTERGNHARTRELLRLALKPSGADVAVDGAPRSPARRHASASPGSHGHHQSPSSSHLAPSEVPGFVRHASAAQQTLAPRAFATSSSVVNDIFDRVTHTSARRQRSPNRATTPGPAARSPAGFRSPSATSSHRAGGGGGASVSGRSRGTAASNGGSAFGSRTDRFRPVTLSGHHGMYVSRSAQSYSDELSRTEAKKLASEMQRAGMITPTRTGRGQPHPSSPQPSPIFTGVVKASPSSSTLRSPDIAKWVRQLQH